MAQQLIMTDTQRLYGLQAFFGYLAVLKCPCALTDVLRAMNPRVSQETNLVDSEAMWWVADMYDRVL